MYTDVIAMKIWEDMKKDLFDPFKGVKKDEQGVPAKAESY